METKRFCFEANIVRGQNFGKVIRNAFGKCSRRKDQKQQRVRRWRILGEFVTLKRLNISFGISFSIYRRMPKPIK